MKLLINSQPLLVLKELAEQIGLNEAIFLQQLHYWITSDSAHFIDEKWWVYNTYEDWKDDNFPFWSIKTLKRIVNNLRDKGLIITTDKHNNWIQDHTLWYTIDYEKLKFYEDESIKLQAKRRKNKENKKKIRDERKLTRKIMEVKKSMVEVSKVEQGHFDPTAKTSKIEQGQNGPTGGSKWPDGRVKMARAIPEITTKITSKITPNNNTEGIFTNLELKSIVEKIEKTVNGKISLKIFKSTIHKNNIKLKDIELYLKNWNRFDYKTKDDPVAFFLHCVITKRPIPTVQNAKNTSTKPEQSTNFDQREYDDEFFENLYDNFRNCEPENIRQEERLNVTEELVQEIKETIENITDFKVVYDNDIKKTLTENGNQIYLILKNLKEHNNKNKSYIERTLNITLATSDFERDIILENQIENKN